MQDDAACYKVRSVIEFLAESDVQDLVRPGMSPGMNPIENLWAVVEKKLKRERRLIPKLSSSAFGTETKTSKTPVPTWYPACLHASKCWLKSKEIILDIKRVRFSKFRISGIKVLRRKTYDFCSSSIIHFAHLHIIENRYRKYYHCLSYHLCRQHNILCRLWLL